MPDIRSLTLAFALAVAATAAAAAEPDVFVIQIEKYKFIPEDAVIKPGTTVRWVNNEKRQFHNVWFREAGEEPGEYLFPGDTYERTFDTPGDFPYVCQPHMDHMRGRIRVEE
jgi:plastocyanin